MTKDKVDGQKKSSENKGKNGTERERLRKTNLERKIKGDGGDKKSLIERNSKEEKVKERTDKIVTKTEKICC